MKRLLLPLITCCLSVLFGNHSSALAAPAVRQQVPLIVGEKSGEGYNSRMRAVQELTLDLRHAEVEDLLAFLKIKTENDPLKPDHLNAVKNDVVVMLLRQNRPAAGLVSQQLIETFQNEEMDAVWRDYCLQHLTTCHGLLPDGQKREDIVDRLWEATQLTENTFAGTALLALRRIMQNSPTSVAPERLANTALMVAKDANMPRTARISGVQVASGHPEILTLSRKLAQDVTADMLLRMSAVGVLGKSLAPEDIAILKRFSKSSDIRLRMSARAGLRNQPK